MCRLALSQRLIITDVTAMHGTRVCIAGISTSGRCLRPVLPHPGVLRTHLFYENEVIIFPRAEVELDLSSVHVQKPHIEDKQFNPASVQFIRKLSLKEWREFLESNAFPSVSDIYDHLIQSGRYVLPGADTRSLGTIICREIHRVQLLNPEGGRTYRLHFSDQSGVRYSYIPITDLAFRLFCDKRLSKGGHPIKIEKELYNIFRSAERIILRLGLARPWPPGEEKCYLQVTGIYTFPDYLGGKTFADFQT